ncbi:MAG: LAGLIDADG family homing endonuclease [archaeon]
MKFNLSNIKLSKADIRRKIVLPIKLTKELAEFIGIMVGDGHIRSSTGISKTGSKFQRSDVIITGSLKEKNYLEYVMVLFKRLFNIEMYSKRDFRSKTIQLFVHSMAVVQFLNKICEIKLNKKSDVVRVSEIIKNSNKNCKCAFLRGLADTDFSVSFQNKNDTGHKYPVIKGSFRSKNLVSDLELLFLELGFKYCTYYDENRPDKRFSTIVVMHNIYLYGKHNLLFWINEIGFSNEKFIRKIRKWEQDGFCPPGY